MYGQSHFMLGSWCFERVNCTRKEVPHSCYLENAFLSWVRLYVSLRKYEAVYDPICYWSLACILFNPTLLFLREGCYVASLAWMGCSKDGFGKETFLCCGASLYHIGCGIR